MQHRRFLAACLVFGFWLFLPAAACFAQTPALTEAQRLEIALEALSRVQGDIRTNAELQSAVYNLLKRVRGTAHFVQIVKKFAIQDQDEGLLECAAQSPANETGVEALRLILAHDNLALLRTGLANTKAGAAALIVSALGQTKEKKAVPLLRPMVADTTRDLFLRKTAVEALAQTQEGAGELLKLAQEEKLPPDLKLTATSELAAVRWPKIKAEAEKVLPAPQGQNAQPLPPISDLLKMKSDLANGEKIFFQEQSMCSKCHQAKGRGGDIGPSLAEIGDKLGPDALLEAIIEPNAGISFGFEANQIELKSGDEAYGLVVSDSENEIAVKDLNGLVTRHQKKDIAKRQVLQTSLMPSGLAATMSPQELVDLAGFLASLKKAGN